MQSISEQNLKTAMTRIINARTGRSDIAVEGAARFIDRFKQLCAYRPSNILLTTFNMPDGLGDFVNLVSYLTLMNNHLGHIPNVNIQSLAILSDNKIGSVKFVVPDNCTYYIYQPGTDFDDDKASKSQIIIINCKYTGQGNIHIKLDDMNNAIEIPYIKSMFEKADCLLNVATPLECTNSIFLKHLKNNCWVRSILEYGPPMPIEMFTPNNAIYVEQSMGFRQEDTGIKFNENIWKMQSSKLNHKPIRLLNLSNLNLLENLLTLGNANEPILTPQLASQYMSNVFLAIGYLQDNEGSLTNYANNFLLLIASVSNKNLMDIIVNTKLININNIKKQLSELGINKIMICDNEAVMTSEVEISASGNKFMRAINYSGLSTHDIEHFYALANVCGGSGDNSTSDVLSANSFPFFGILNHKVNTTRELIDYIVRNKLDAEGHLTIYLSILSQTVLKSDVINYDINELCLYAKEYFNNIKIAWENVCKHLYTEKNNLHKFHELLALYMHTVYMRNIHDEVDIFKYNLSLFEHNSSVVLANEHLINTAISVGNTSCVDLLCHEGTGLQSRTARDGVSPLHHAMLSRQEEIATLILHSLFRIPVYAGNADNLFILAMGFSKKFFRKFLEGDVIIHFRSRDEMNKILNYISSDEIMLSNAINTYKFSKYNINLFLYWAIKNNKFDLALHLVGAGAEIEINKEKLNAWSDFDDDSTTALHLVLLSKNRDFIIKFLQRYTFVLYDQINPRFRLPSEIATDNEIKILIEAKSCRTAMKNFVPNGCKSVMLDANFESNQPDKIIIEFNDFVDAWQFWSLLRNKNIICNRPRSDENTIIIVRAEFEALMRNHNYLCPVLPVPNGFVKEIMQLNLEQFISAKFQNQATIISHGIDGITIQCSQSEFLETLRQYLLEHFNIRSTACKQDSTLEIIDILTQQKVTQFQLMVNYEHCIKNLITKFSGPIEKLDYFIDDENNVRIQLSNAADAFYALNQLFKYNIFSGREDATHGCLVLSMNNIASLLKGEIVPLSLHTERSNSILRSQISKVCASEDIANPHSIDIPNGKSLVIKFSQEKDTGAFEQILKANFITYFHCKFDNSIEILSDFSSVKELMKKMSETKNILFQQQFQFAK